LNVVQFRPSPLRERSNDVVLLADSFLQHFNATMNKHVRGFFGGHAPETALLPLAGQRARIAQRHRARRHFGKHAGNPASQPAGLSFGGAFAQERFHYDYRNESLDELMADFERQVINTTLEQSRYNISKTAEQLKISRHACATGCNASTSPLAPTKKARRRSRRNPNGSLNEGLRL